MKVVRVEEVCVAKHRRGKLFGFLTWCFYSYSAPLPGERCGTFGLVAPSGRYVFLEPESVQEKLIRKGDPLRTPCFSSHFFWTSSWDQTNQLSSFPISFAICVSLYNSQASWTISFLNSEADDNFNYSKLVWPYQPQF